MTKIERIEAVLSGREPDRPPLSLWYHFGVQHGSGEQFARLSLEFFDHYDVDFLKVMNDYFYPSPPGLTRIASARDLRHLGPLTVEEAAWSRQFRALELIAGQLQGRAFFIDTVFDPWQTIRRMAGENMPTLMAEAPSALLDALEVVADNLIAYCKKSLALGSAGMFMSVPAASEIVARDDFMKFVKPPAQKVFAAIAGMGRMNTAHIHGQDLFFDDCLDFPVPIFNWWDRGPNGPSLAEVKLKTGACVMGGIDQTIVARTSPAFLADHVRQGLRLGGKDRFFIANGCSIDTWANPAAIRSIVTAVRSDRNDRS
ncbi:MAG: uroporphyrinogen decarboxylase family protein [Desulfobacterales bacterium]